MNESALPELPGGWVWTRLGEICLDPQYGWTTSAISEGALHLLRTTDITSGNIDWSTVPFCSEEPPEKEKYLLKDGDIVISRAGSVGYSHLIKNPKRAIFASYLIRFRPIIDEKYLAYFIKSPLYWDSISEKSLGIAIPNVNATKLKQIFIPLSPLPEQCRIVTKIEELFTRLDAGVSELKKTQVQLKRYRQSVLKDACEGKLVPTEAELANTEERKYEPADVLLRRILKEKREKWNGKGKYKEPAAQDTNGLPELPEGWCWASLPHLGELARGKSKHRPRDDKKLFGGQYPFIQTGDVKNSNGKIKTYSQTYSEFGLAQSRLWPAGTLCITIAANIADSSLLTFPSCFPDSVVGFVCEEIHCDIRFIEFFIRTAKKDLEKYAPATAQKNINLETLGKLAVPIPPLAEQRRIVAEVECRLSIADGVEKTVGLSLTQAERLRQSILKKAFEGRLVAQDASDEPAGVLLERIKAEKMHTGNGTKKSKQIKLSIKDVA